LQVAFSSTIGAERNRYSAVREQGGWTMSGAGLTTLRCF
jgi:hypothetical protein